MSEDRRAGRTAVSAAIVLVCVVAAGLVAYVASAARSAVTPQALASPAGAASAAAPAPGVTDVARASLTRTVTIEAVATGQEQFGTGWLVDSKGDFVTNAHVLSGALAIRLRARDGTSHVGVIVGSNTQDDVAVVRSSDGFAGAPLPVATRAARSGDDVVVVASSRATGHDDITPAHVDQTGATVASDGESGSAFVRDYSGMIAMSGPEIYQGNSGGPLLDGNGDVVGIVTLTSTGRAEAYAIPIGSVIAVIRSFTGG